MARRVLLLFSMAGSAEHAPRETLPGGTRLGAYEIVRHIASGGMAEIYLARIAGTTKPGKYVVLKRILPELSHRGVYIKMFLDEARVTASVKHPNIVELLDVCLVGGNPFLVLEYLPGEDVRSVIVGTVQQQGRLPLEAALHITMSLARALEHVHERTDAEGRPLQIVHCDVTPQNVMVTLDGQVKLLDFGVAQTRLRSTWPSGGVLKGKIPYMSPEQLIGQRLDRRSDVFALGVMMYELTLCRRLFGGANDLEIMRRIIEEPVLPPSLQLPEYPKGLERILLTALQRDRDLRYSSAAQFLAALEGFVLEQGLSISPDSTRELMRQVFFSEADSRGRRRRRSSRNLPALGLGGPLRDATTTARTLPARQWCNSQ